MKLPHRAPFKSAPFRSARRRSATVRWLLIATLLFALGCEQRTEESDTGGVLLEVEFTNTVLFVGVEETSVLTIPTININSIVADPAGTTSSLMDVQLRTLEVTFSRADTGTRVPPPYFANIIGTVPVGGTLTLNNFPIMSQEQLRAPPLSDLLIANGGFDRETGQTVIRLDITFRAFGTTLPGTSVATQPRTQTTEFVPTLLGI